MGRTRHCARRAVHGGRILSTERRFIGSRNSYDTVIRNGSVTTTRTSEIADIAIQDGKIAQIGGSPSGRVVFDAEGCVVTPGGIDMHVHLTPLEDAPVPLRPDDFYIGSRAAANGGITTVGNMTHQKAGGGLLTALSETEDEASRLSVVDFVLHPVLREPSPLALADLRQLVPKGFGSLKVFMPFEAFEQRQSDYAEAFRIAAETGVLVLVHAEDGSMIRERQAELVRGGTMTSAHYHESRPIASEAAAVARALEIGESFGTPMLFVHLSSLEALDLCRRARARGYPAYVETRPLYLHLTDSVFSEENPARFVGNPPPRSEEDRRALWEGIRSGAVDILASDHAPWTLAQKLERSHDIREVLPGVSELDTMLPMFFSEGVVQGRISPQEFVQVTASRPAELFGLADKGSIHAGADADLTIWDPSVEWRVDPAHMISDVDYSPYDGWEVNGIPRLVLRRGSVVRDPDGVQTSAGGGRMVRSEGMERDSRVS